MKSVCSKAPGSKKGNQAWSRSGGQDFETPSYHQEVFIFKLHQVGDRPDGNQIQEPFILIVQCGMLLQHIGDEKGVERSKLIPSPLT